MYKELERHIEEMAAELGDLSRAVWEFAEVGLQEERSARAQIQYLEANGFKVTAGTGGMPTAFVAEWGKGKPVLGFLGEYDALAGLSQEAIPTKAPVEEGAPGHGCGHNLLGVGALGAAVALKRLFSSSGGEATVRYYGCPAEETLVGKVFMARDGAFSDLDAAITWHPGATNTVGLGSSNGVNSAKFTFHGRTAHAAGDPHNGRSALDAVELMNVGANYLREHVIPQARLHYVITDGGGQPNVVPDRAEVWYYVRAPRRRQVEEVYGRLLDVARGAALMTGTTFDVNFLAGCYDVLPNTTLAGAALAQFKEVGAPQWSPEDHEFARQLASSVDRADVVAGLRSMGAPPELTEQILNVTVIDPMDKGKAMAGSTDVGDVSWLVPTVSISAASWPIGIPGHSWQVTAASGHSVGVQGMVTAAKVMARTGLLLASEPKVLEDAWIEFRASADKEPYKTPLPEGLEPPLSQFAKT